MELSFSPACHNTEIYIYIYIYIIYIYIYLYNYSVYVYIEMVMWYPFHLGWVYREARRKRQCLGSLLLTHICMLVHIGYTFSPIFNLPQNRIYVPGDPNIWRVSESRGHQKTIGLSKRAPTICLSRLSHKPIALFNRA